MIGLKAMSFSSLRLTRKNKGGNILPSDIFLRKKVSKWEKTINLKLCRSMLVRKYIYEADEPDYGCV